MNKRYSQNDPLMATRGKIHKYLGMTIDFRNCGSIAFSQYDAINKFWLSLPNYLYSSCRNAPRLENLFKVDIESPRLDTEWQEQYYLVTAKSLYFSQ